MCTFAFANRKKRFAEKAHFSPYSEFVKLDTSPKIIGIMGR